MANVNVPGRFVYPYTDPTLWNSNNNGLSSTLDNANDYFAFVFTVPKTGTLNTAHFMMTQQTTIEDIHVSFQDVDSNGDPDGTADQFRVYTPVGGDLDNYISPGLITSTGADGGTKRSVTQGDKLAVVIRFDSTGGDIDILRGIGRDNTKDEGAPYILFSTDAGTNWSPSQVWCAIMLEYDDGIAHVPDCLPLKDRNQYSLATTSSPTDELGFKFQVPFACKVVGVIIGGAVTDVVVGIEDASKVVVATAVRPFWENDTASGVKRYVYFEQAEVTLAANTDYYITWRPTTTSSRITYSWDIEDAGARAAFPWGTTSSVNTREDNGSWSELTTETMLVSLIISGIDDGAGGGGGGGDVVTPVILKPVTSGLHAIY